MIATIQDWQDELETLHQCLAPRFRRAEPRRRAFGYLKGLLSDARRKNGWQLAEQIGEARPDGVQRLLNAASWDADQVRNDLRSYAVEHLAVEHLAVEHLGDEEAVLIVDETGFVKKGTKSVGVKRQYSGTAGRIANCQGELPGGRLSLLRVFSPRVFSPRAFWRSGLYRPDAVPPQGLPKEWAEDAERRSEAGVPEEVRFATKPELARQMLDRAFDASVPCAWVLGDTIYGKDRKLRVFLEQRKQPFVLGIPSNEPLWIAALDRWAQLPPDVRACRRAGLEELEAPLGRQWFEG